MYHYMYIYNYMYNYMDDVNEADIRVNHKKINGMNHSVSEATGSASFSGSDESRRIWVSLSFSCNFGIEKNICWATCNFYRWVSCQILWFDL
jgi:hypothetical protein